MSCPSPIILPNVAHTRMIRITLLLCLSGLVVLLAWWGLWAFSAIPMSLSTPYDAFFSSQPPGIAETVIVEIRLPRVIEAILVGAGLAVAGLLMQTLTRNPLASPSLFGVNAGAALGVALTSTLFLQQAYLSQPIAAIVGGALAWTIVVVLGGAWRTGAERKQLVLAGIAVSALCAAMTKALVILVEDQATGVMTWLAGSFASVSWQQVVLSWPPLLLALLMAWALAPKLNLFALGDERVQSLGVRLTWIRAFTGLLVFIIVGVCVSAVGSIAFVGLIVPHMARKLFGYDLRWLVPGTALVGAMLTLSADMLSRWVIFPSETPAGAVLALMGAPCFIYLVRKER
ncbi:iron chelate uptake ABC transporter family permease subunit [Vibrio spartinae]|uniref:Fe(3+) dicitrate transport system permease protein FecC n=2 Tax=Vibrio spartinae TaxID=1918945 RepID=A0A1N6M952_9VIBR|nr:iron chelate uptake ABC transporter family permease subunit [Vibrio spartinae]QMV16164.1 Iron(III) dicitrate transport system permease protein FecC [Vibrio spartinae]SIO95975.1 Fe(3+) dicitrate transport system permease protein FecC [Vibrio spartinae]